MGDVIAVNKYEGIRLDEYKGNYSLLSMKDNNGKYWPVYARYQKGKDDLQEKAWPVKCALGDKATAIGALKMILRELEG